MDNTTMMMTMEVTFIGWWGWLMLYPLFKVQVQTQAERDRAEMNKVRRAHGIDTDACDAAWEKRNGNS